MRCTRKTWPEATDAAPSRNNPHTTRRDTPSLAHRCGHAGVLASHILLSLLILQLATLPHIVIRVWVRWNLLLVALLFEQLAVVVPLLRALVDVLLEGVHLQLPVAVELPVRTGELPNCRAVAVHHDHRTTVARVPDIARPLRLWIQLLRRQHSGPYDLVGVPGVLQEPRLHLSNLNDARRKGGSTVLPGIDAWVLCPDNAAEVTVHVEALHLLDSHNLVHSFVPKISKYLDEVLQLDLFAALQLDLVGHHPLHSSNRDVNFAEVSR
mmetsp:Transcript_117999/g.313962  ORF Transcript_117999/g.313962 Transcript_117999/m.313962 type:complete len:267 (+) Transcript_117999:327-1127(+)